MLEEFDGENTSDDDDPLLSLVLGLSMRKPMNNGLIFAPELFYVAKGLKDENSDGKISMNYIEIPILFRYGFETTGMIKPFVTGGPSLALQLSCNYFDADGDKASCEDVYGADDTYTKFDAGVMLGAGITRERVSVSLRYDFGLLNLDKADGWTAKHRALMILLGFDL